MTKLTKTLAKGTLGTVAAGAMALATATPAAAQDRHRDRGVDAGDVIAGAVIIGGIAALAGAFDGDRKRDYRNRGYRDRGYNHNVRYNNRGFNNGRNAVDRCVRAAERQASRFGGYRFANVTQIRDVDRTRFGFRVKGRIEVEGARGYRGRDFDRGRFTCFFDGRGRPQIDFDGIRGLR
ncbi:hypothetical protein FGU71_11005 [Erythrobacter insulae]|uniref:Uncharacterized protein n=1 Tax=Erythrobacter insulae TaxID=2584124 RepID=A0A547PDX0_9SPHN|nr:hypothetical protein [Erythrobacter insulae]TRD12342.1 hypothetical protein FGU71_11005 [Erythrobacter insulae]